ncbi:hypothetical protein C900_04809 [Fulvivirga imtechensis AK7]|uniref:Methyltransferase n=1 Tax=Fulvivirga imtechensis AK7 TaxID=1237149 RepID=L8JQ04_9BACT|nr:hypothetical protein [Fulvivirga imtechensis]ELR69584.1 hypothetical protein C900_04809 [Fulvivirga imtechensis AK7]
MRKNKLLHKRYEKTLAFLKQHLDKGDKILDLGTKNPFSGIMKANGFEVSNTQGENLDIDYQKYIDYEVDAVTAFEIFEHMLAPSNILRALKAKKLIASVPLKLWFANAYWNEKDDWDKHYHEFEKKQFDFLLDQTGWKIKDSQTWMSSDWKKIGIRPILRHFTPRYYIVYCERRVS